MMGVMTWKNENSNLVTMVDGLEVDRLNSLLVARRVKTLTHNSHNSQPTTSYPTLCLQLIPPNRIQTQYTQVKMMQDPMADLGTDPTAQGASSDNVKHGKQVLDPFAMQMNMQRIDRIRSVMGIVSGCFVGIVGLTGLQGFGTCSL